MSNRNAATATVVRTVAHHIVGSEPDARLSHSSGSSVNSTARYSLGRDSVREATSGWNTGCFSGHHRNGGFPDRKGFLFHTFRVERWVFGHSSSKCTPHRGHYSPCPNCTPICLHRSMDFLPVSDKVWANLRVSVQTSTRTNRRSRREWSRDRAPYPAHAGQVSAIPLPEPCVQIYLHTALQNPAYTKGASAAVCGTCGTR